MSFTSGREHAEGSLAAILKSHEIHSRPWPAGECGQCLWGESELTCTAEAHF